MDYVAILSLLLACPRGAFVLYLFAGRNPTSAHPLNCAQLTRQHLPNFKPAHIVDDPGAEEKETPGWLGIEFKVGDLSGISGKGGGGVLRGGMLVEERELVSRKGARQKGDMCLLNT